MSTVSTAPRTSSAARVAGGVAAALVLSLIADTVVALVAKALGADKDFQPFQFGSYFVLTLVGVLAATAGWSLIRSRATNPAAVLRVLVPVVLVVSFVPDVGLLASGQMGTGAGEAIALMVMHVLVAAVTVTMLTRVLPVGPVRS